MADAVEEQVSGVPLGSQKAEQSPSSASTLSKSSSRKQFTSSLPSKPTTVTCTAATGKSQPVSASGSADALGKIRAARADAAVAAASASPEAVASTISKAKEALAKARSGASPGGSLQGGHSTTKLSEGVGIISDKPFMLYGRTEVKPKVPVQISAPSNEEHARRKAWSIEKEAMKQRRLAQEQARKEREAAAKAAAAAARTEAHRKLMEERKAKYEAFKVREAEMLVKSEQAWKQYQEQRGRPPLFKLMEEEYQHKRAAEEETKRAQYEAEIAAGKMATVSQLVKGEVVVKPLAGSISPAGSHSPGGALHSSLGSGDHSHLKGRISPNASMANIHAPTAARGAAAGKSLKWPGANPAAAAVGKQLVDRACSPLTPDGSIPPGAKVLSTRLGRAGEAHRSSSQKVLSSAAQQAEEQEREEDQQQVEEQDHDQMQQSADLDESGTTGAMDEGHEQQEDEADADEGPAAEADEEEQLQDPEADQEGAEVETDPTAAEVDAEEGDQQNELQDGEQSAVLEDADEQQEQDEEQQEQEEQVQQEQEQPEEQYDEEQAEGQGQDDGAAAEVDDAEDAAQGASAEDAAAEDATAENSNE